MTTQELRRKAIDETKIGGDPAKAVALALLYIGDCLPDEAAVASALEAVAVELSAVGRT